jgi:hypothetical protein
MKTVKITIEVKVPNRTKFVAVDKNGYVYAYSCVKPVALSNESVWDIAGDIEESEKFSKREVYNWRDTLTKVE